MTQATQTQAPRAGKEKKADSSKSTHPMADKIKDTLHDSVDTLAEKAAAAEQGLRDSAEKGSENLARRKEQLESSWEQSSVKRYVSENPVKTAGLAFAAGVVLASFLKSK